MHEDGQVLLTTYKVGSLHRKKEKAPPHTPRLEHWSEFDAEKSLKGVITLYFFAVGKKERDLLVLYCACKTPPFGHISYET